MNRILLLLLYLYSLICLSIAIVCYDCRADDSTCNSGQCSGAVCVKMETANLDNGKFVILNIQANCKFF